MQTPPLRLIMKRKKTLTCLATVFIALLLHSPAFAQQEESVASLDRIVSQIDSMFPPVEGYVIAVEGETLTLDLKQGQSVQTGDKLKVIRYGKDIIHPVTKKKVGRKETDLGMVEILEVRKDFSLAQMSDPSIEIQAGDGVRSPFQKLSFIVAPPRVKTKKKVDVDRLRLNLENRLNRHNRFEVPSFELGVWLLENGLNTKTMLEPGNLERLREKVQADLILVPKVGDVKDKMVLSYQLFSTEDGSLKQQSKILSDQLPIAPKVSKKFIPEEDVQGSFARREGLFKFVGKNEFPFEIVDFDIGDVNGDGVKEFIVIDQYRVMIFDYKNGKFKRRAQVKTREGLNFFLGVDVADINGNGRDEIFVTNHIGSKLESFVLEFVPGSKGPQKIWKDVNLYFRIIHPFDSKPILLAQAPGFRDPFHGPIKTIQYTNNRYSDGPEIRTPSIYGTEFILYGLTQTDLNGDGLQDTIALDTEYHLRVYSASGRLLVKSNDYYGHDPRIIDVGVKEDIAGIVTQGEPVQFKGRLQFLKSGGKKFLLLPRNHRIGGQLLAKAVIVENSNLVVLSLTQEGFEKVFETKKQRGYLAAYQVMTLPDSSKNQVHMATVEKARGLSGKKTSTIYTYDWAN